MRATVRLRSLASVGTNTCDAWGREGLLEGVKCASRGPAQRSAAQMDASTAGHSGICLSAGLLWNCSAGCDRVQACEAEVRTTPKHLWKMDPPRERQPPQPRPAPASPGHAEEGQQGRQAQEERPGAARAVSPGGRPPRAGRQLQPLRRRQRQGLATFSLGCSAHETAAVCPHLGAPAVGRRGAGQKPGRC